MHAFFQRSLVRAVFAVTCTALWACGGPARPPESPATAVGEPPRSGSATQDLAGSAAVEKEALPPAPTTATSSTDNGSDIIPPFSGAKKNEKSEKTEKSGKGAAKKRGGKRARSSDRGSPST